jgi:hypothetical protein
MTIEQQWLQTCESFTQATPREWSANDERLYRSGLTLLAAVRAERAIAEAEEALERANAVYAECNRALWDANRALYAARDAARAARDAYPEALRREART